MKIFENQLIRILPFLAGLLFLNSCSSTLKTVGYLEGEDHLIASALPGKVEQILVREGETVIKGQPLAVLDAQELRVNLKNAEAALSVLNSELERARSVLNRLSKGNPLYSRLKQVYEVGGISKSQLNQASGASGDSSLRSQADLLVRELESKKATAEAHVEELKALSRETTLLSPADGMVTKRYIQEGQRVKAGDPAFIVTQLKRMYLGSSLPERELAKIRIGQDVVVTVEGFPGKTWDGQLTQIESTTEFGPDELAALLDPNYRIRRIKILLQNTDGLLKPGMKARAKIPFSN